MNVVPDELIVIVLQFLDFKSLVACTAVSHTFKAIEEKNSSLLWLTHMHNTYQAKPPSEFKRDTKHSPNAGTGSKSLFIANYLHEQLYSPLLRKGYAFTQRLLKRQEKDISHFGGLPHVDTVHKWPNCCNCGFRMSLLLQIDRSDIPADCKLHEPKHLMGNGTVQRKLVQLYVCCSGSLSVEKRRGREPCHQCAHELIECDILLPRRSETLQHQQTLPDDVYILPDYGISIVSTLFDLPSSYTIKEELHQYCELLRKRIPAVQSLSEYVTSVLSNYTPENQSLVSAKQVIPALISRFEELSKQQGGFMANYETDEYYDMNLSIAAPMMNKLDGHPSYIQPLSSDKNICSKCSSEIYSVLTIQSGHYRFGRNEGQGMIQQCECDTSLLFYWEN